MKDTTTRVVHMNANPVIILGFNFWQIISLSLTCSGDASDSCNSCGFGNHRTLFAN